MKVYPVTEADMLSLKVTTGLSSLLFSLGFAIVGYAIDILISGSEPAGDSTLVHYTAPIMLVCGIALVAGGSAAAVAHWVTWGRVKRNTRSISVGSGD